MAKNKAKKVKAKKIKATADAQIDWDKLATKIAKLIEYKSGTTFVTIKAEGWEEILYVALSVSGYKVDWDPSDHAKGTDLKVLVGDKEMLISAKAGKVNEANTAFSMSSYRLTRYETLEDKLKFLKENAKELDLYLVSPRLETADKIEYNIFKIDPLSLTPPELLKTKNWTKKGDNWLFESKTGLKASIRESMSHQLWYEIPLGFKSLEKITSVLIERKKMGQGLVQALKEKEN